MNRNKIVIGPPTNPLFQFENDQLRQVDVVMRSSFSGDELAYDQLNGATFAGEPWDLISNELYDLYSNEDYQLVSSPADLTAEIPAETAIRYYVNDALMGKFYSMPAERENTLVYDVMAVSAIGLLVRRIHKGGLYNGQTIAQVLAEIINGAFPFSCSADVASTEVYGWLPYTKDARENLHQLLFAYGVMVYKDENGDAYFDYADTQLKTTIDDDNIYQNGSVTSIEPATKVRVAEHSFYQLSTDQQYTLFDNTGETIANNLLVLFDNAPIHDLATTGTLQIIESGVNYAVVSGTGTLTGKAYTHTKQVYEEGTNDGNVLEFTQQTLVNQLNSVNVVRRLLNYYGVTVELSTDIQVTTEKPGQLVQLTNPYKEQTNAYIREMTITGLATAKARCAMLADFTPTKGGNNYQNRRLFTADGSFTVPAGVTQIRIILGQGGAGGAGGNNGTAGQNGSAGEGVAPGQGGAAGNGGSPGKLYVANISVTPGQSYAVTIGAGGVGGALGTAGTAGGETTFGSYSSASGTIPESGYYDVFEGLYYCISGENGVPGADGGAYSGSGHVAGSVTDGAQTWAGGQPGETSIATGYSGHKAYGVGGGGSGAAYGSAGANGSNGSTEMSAGYNSANAYGGNGAAGANAAPKNYAPTPGSGGIGGNGGGGGGAGGPAEGAWRGEGASTAWGRNVPGTGGSGGSGTAGGNGGSGFAMVLY